MISSSKFSLWLRKLCAKDDLNVAAELTLTVPQAFFKSNRFISGPNTGVMALAVHSFGNIFHNLPKPEHGLPRSS